MMSNSNNHAMSNGPTVAREVYARKVEAYADAVRPIAMALRQRGLSLRQIGIELLAQEVHTIRGGRWTSTAVRRLLARTL